ncbi:MAG: TIGR00269 family protein [Candidatus Diapherotrites archaeon]|nr:TIGR00269 family protein [Candidatus Diapherotrites archaeon]
MQKCNRCSKEAKVFLAYGPHSFCKMHFLEFFEKRVRKTINKFRLVKPGERIAVGVSGGKDSITTLHLLKKIFPKGTEIHAVCIDEGIKGYRDKALKIAEQHFEELDVDYTILKMKKELGFSMAEIAKKLNERKHLQGTQGTCSYCGVFRRKMLNDFAFKEKFDKLATGHNLDDEVQTILMNVLQNDLAKFSRLGPIAAGESKLFVPRIKPLYETPEKEIIAFSQYNGWKVYNAECCPFSRQAKRNAFRKAMDEIEGKYPNVKYSAISFYQGIKPFLKDFGKESKIRACKSCGMPSSGFECASCIQLKKLSN